MLRYKNKGYTIEINLPEGYGYNGYSIECTYKYDRTKNLYSLTMWLKHNSIGDKYKIESQEMETRYIMSTRESIKKDICLLIEKMCLGEFLDRYIERYEYMSNCFDRGNAMVEAGEYTYDCQ